MMKKATAVLDFGTSKVLVLLAEESAYQKVTITSAGMAQYDGFMNGEWNAPDTASFIARPPAAFTAARRASSDSVAHATTV